MVAKVGQSYTTFAIKKDTTHGHITNPVSDLRWRRSGLIWVRWQLIGSLMANVKLVTSIHGCVKKKNLQRSETKSSKEG